MAGGTLAACFDENRLALLRYLRARGAGDDVEDLLQDLWLKIREVEIIAGDHRAYLYRMAHNLMLDRARAAMRRRGRENAFQHDRLSGSIDDAPSADRVLVARERLVAIDAVLRGLGERTDYIFRRYRVDDVPPRDIGAELGIMVSAVEKHLKKPIERSPECSGSRPTKTSPARHEHHEPRRGARLGTSHPRPDLRRLGGASRVVRGGARERRGPRSCAPRSRAGNGRPGAGRRVALKACACSGPGAGDRHGRRLQVRGGAKGAARRIEFATGAGERRAVRLPGSVNAVLMGCANGVMIVADTGSGRIVAALRIGRGNDAMAYDPVRHRVFSSNGIDGTGSVFEQLSPDRYRALEPIATKARGRTMALDPATGRLFVAAADTQPAEMSGSRPCPLPGTLRLLAYDPAR